MRTWPGPGAGAGVGVGGTADGVTGAGLAVAAAALAQVHVAAAYRITGRHEYARWTGGMAPILGLPVTLVGKDRCR